MPMSTPLTTRRHLLKTSTLACLGYLGVSSVSYAKTYLTPSQAKALLFGKEKATKQPITLTKDQAKQIKKDSKVRVRHTELNVYKTASGDWLIFDEIIGKHENIDIAIAITKNGKVKGVEILVYRETYGHEIRNLKWRAQFLGKSNEDQLKLDDQIKNISGATLSCRHVTDAINRWTSTWDLILKTI